MALQRPSCPTSSRTGSDRGVKHLLELVGQPRGGGLHLSSRSLYTPGCRAFYRYPTRWYLAGAPKVKLGLEGNGLVQTSYPSPAH